MKICATLLLPALLAAQTPAQIDALFSDYDRPNVPGASVIVIHDARIAYRHAYGLADVEAHVAATSATNYRLASVTKQFTAMCILMLAERHKLSLDDSLTAIFPDYAPYGSAVTIRHLLTHTSGLLAYEDLVPAGQTEQVKDLDVLNYLKHQDHTYFPPGSAYRYSNTGYAHLAMIVEKASGMRFAEFLKKNIFEPLHMAGTLAYEAGISTVPHRAYGYSRHGDGFERTDQSVTSAVLGDGGIYSSVDDLYLWDQALYTTKLVSAETLRQAFTPAVLTNGKSTNYGFGWEIGELQGVKTIRHNGSTIGFRTAILRIPDRKLSIVVLANRSEAKPEQIADRIAALYMR